MPTERIRSLLHVVTVKAGESYAVLKTSFASPKDAEEAIKSYARYAQALGVAAGLSLAISTIDETRGRSKDLETVRSRLVELLKNSSNEAEESAHDLTKKRASSRSRSSPGP